MDRLEPTPRRWNVLPGKKGGELVAEGHKGKWATALVLMDNQQTPLGVIIAASNKHESRHVEGLIDAAVVELPKQAHLVYDKVADIRNCRILSPISTLRFRVRIAFELKWTITNRGVVP